MKKLIAAAALIACFSAPAFAETPVFEITIKDHKFSPDSIEVPVNQKVKLVIKNQDPSSEEFESHELSREKVIAGNSEGIVFIGPLKAGEYPFVGEFHESTAKGKIIAK